MLLFMADLYAFLAGARIAAFLYMVFVIAILIFAIIGIITTIRFFVRRKRNKKQMTPGERWMKTGRVD